jgi:glutathione S-transferase
MILIGQYDSPFVRRIGITLTLYGLEFEHRPWSVFGDGTKLQAINPLMRVPTLVLDGGDVLVDSPSMIDYLDHLVPEAQVMLPLREPARRRAMAIVALATGLAEKAVSMFYEQRFHSTVSDVWLERCKSQIHAVMTSLEAGCGAKTGPYWFGDRLSHADIAVGCALRFIREAHPGLVAIADFPALRNHTAVLEALPAFRIIQQPFLPPA